MVDKSCLELSDIRRLMSEIIMCYMEGVRDKSAGSDARQRAARLAESALCNYLKIINTTEVERELAQLQRSDWPKPFETNE